MSKEKLTDKEKAMRILHNVMLIGNRELRDLVDAYLPRYDDDDEDLENQSKDDTNEGEEIQRPAKNVFVNRPPLEIQQVLRRMGPISKELKRFAKVVLEPKTEAELREAEYRYNHAFMSKKKKQVVSLAEREQQKLVYNSIVIKRAKECLFIAKVRGVLVLLNPKLVEWFEKEDRALPFTTKKNKKYIRRGGLPTLLGHFTKKIKNFIFFRQMSIWGKKKVYYKLAKMILDYMQKLYVSALRKKHITVLNRYLNHQEKSIYTLNPRARMFLELLLEKFDYSNDNDSLLRRRVSKLTKKSKAKIEKTLSFLRRKFMHQDSWFIWYGLIVSKLPYVLSRFAKEFWVSTFFNCMIDQNAQLLVYYINHQTFFIENEQDMKRHETLSDRKVFEKEEAERRHSEQLEFDRLIEMENSTDFWLGSVRPTGEVLWTQIPDKKYRIIDTLRLPPSFFYVQLKEGFPSAPLLNSYHRLVEEDASEKEFLTVLGIETLDKK